MVSLLRATSAHEGPYALVVSLSHVLGDGATYYELYHMLDHLASVRKLSPARNAAFDATQKAMLGA